MKKDPTGIYDKRVTLKFPDGSVTVVNGVDVPNYATGATVWAAFDVKPPKGKQMFVGEAEHAASTRWIKIRYIPGITAKWRVVYGGTLTFEIVSPPLDEGMKHRELYLELEAVE